MLPKAQIVVADFPWSYYGDPDKDGAAGKEYALMSDEAVFDFPMADYMMDPGVLFLWATSPKLETAMQAIAEWGLWYRGVAFVWVKTKQDGTTPIGAQGVRPSIVKPTTEFVLAASQKATGRPLPLLDESIRQVVMAPKREHSRKPDEVMERIEQLYPFATPKTELFARYPRQGWQTENETYPS